MNTDYKLNSKDRLTLLAKNNGIDSWNALTKFVKNLPYGRTQNRSNLELVLIEKKGTCSSKHALLKSIADFNTIPNIELVIGIYRMTESNTPKIGTVLSENSIEFIPEAHCYLKINGNRTDLTTESSEFKKIEKDILQEIEIEPKQIGTFKVAYHKTFIKSWLKDTELKFNFDQIWNIREKCIANLTE